MNPREVSTTGPLKEVETEQEIRSGTDAVVIPVIREELSVQIQKHTTGIVRVKKIVGEREELVNLPIHHTDFLVERIPVHKILSEPPLVREEGETTVFSVVEEILVTSTQYLVKEEIRISRQQSQTTHQERFLLRTEELVIEREPAARPGTKV